MKQFVMVLYSSWQSVKCVRSRGNDLSKATMQAASRLKLRLWSREFHYVGYHLAFLATLNWHNAYFIGLGGGGLL